MKDKIVSATWNNVLNNFSRFLPDFGRYMYYYGNLLEVWHAIDTRCKQKELA